MLLAARCLLKSSFMRPNSSDLACANKEPPNRPSKAFSLPVLERVSKKRSALGLGLRPGDAAPSRQAVMPRERNIQMDLHRLALFIMQELEFKDEGYAFGGRLNKRLSADGKTRLPVPRFRQAAWRPDVA